MFSYSEVYKYPENAEYLERLIPETMDDAITYEGAAVFKFRMHTTNDGYTYPIPGLKTNKKIIYKIEAIRDFPFKAGDIIRFEGNDRKKYTITSVEFYISNEDIYVNMNNTWPGFAKDSPKIKIITLE